MLYQWHWQCVHGGRWRSGLTQHRLDSCSHFQKGVEREARLPQSDLAVSSGGADAELEMHVAVLRVEHALLDDGQLHADEGTIPITEGQSRIKRSLGCLLALPTLRHEGARIGIDTWAVLQGEGGGNDPDGVLSSPAQEGCSGRTVAPEGTSGGSPTQPVCSRRALPASPTRAGEPRRRGARLQTP